MDKVCNEKQERERERGKKFHSIAAPNVMGGAANARKIDCRALGCEFFVRAKTYVNTRVAWRIFAFWFSFVFRLHICRTHTLRAMRLTTAHLKVLNE